jgi:hypothetical protein
MEREITYVTYREFTLELITFLKKYNALEGFKKNVLTHTKKHNPQKITQYTIINPLLLLPAISRNNAVAPFVIFDLAFMWSETPEGHEFWHNVDLDWDSYARIKNFRLKDEKP